MRVLIVEDDDKMTRLLKKGLEEERHSVMIAREGNQGLQLAQTNSFDVLVLDVMLPGLNGFEVARRSDRGNDTGDGDIGHLICLRLHPDRPLRLSLGSPQTKRGNDTIQNRLHS